ncbi:MAG TPA: M14 family zinc carboxypeptidase, partial [Terriglobales bacterium]|nr:M14 family zinc carboxypeptidase [Terriglobales bacterium]
MKPSHRIVLSVTLAMFLVSALAPAQNTPVATSIPTPASVFGFEPGADYHLADYEQITQFFQKLAAAAPQRVKLENIGKSGYGREMFVAIITSEANMKQLDHYKQIVQ